MGRQDNGTVILAYRIIKYTLILAVTALYISCFEWGNALIGIIMAVLFGYCFASVANMVINFFVYYTTRPKVLPQVKDIIEKGIPKDVNIVFFRPAFVKSNPEIDTHIDNMRQDLLNSTEPGASMRFMMIDNTRDVAVREYTRQRIRKLQEEFGRDRIFYLHRNVKCDFFKKVGIYEDAIMLLHDGWTRPRHYVGAAWEPHTKGLRNPSEPVFDEVIGDITALGIIGTAEDITRGKEVKIDHTKRIGIAIVQDADNVWPKGEVRKLVAKMCHPANRDYVIWQPSIEISNPGDNGFIRMNSMARQMYGFDPIAKWRIFTFSPFYGKGAMLVDPYIAQIIKKEVLHPNRAASHDFQEALHVWTVLLEDVYIWEKTFSNKLAELTRTALWGWGDLETVRQFLLKPFEGGRKSHLLVLLRNLIGTLVYDLWLIGSVICFLAPSVAVVDAPSRLVRLFAVIVCVNILLPKFIVPIVSKFYKRPYQIPMKLLSQENIVVIAAWGAFETVMSVLIHYLDLVYKPIGFFKNFMKQVMGTSYVWKTGAMSEIETQGMNVVRTYKALRLSTVIGALCLVASILHLWPGFVALFLSPYIASFLLGPIAIWATSR